MLDTPGPNCANRNEFPFLCNFFQNSAPLIEESVQTLPKTEISDARETCSHLVKFQIVPAPGSSIHSSIIEWRADMRIKSELILGGWLLTSSFHLFLFLE
jgi:hypothetical protein